MINQDDFIQDSRTTHDPYLLLIGAVIRQAIVDYQGTGEAGINRHHYESAKHYLFGKTGLEAQIERLNLPLNVSYIRKLLLNFNTPVTGQKRVKI
jgi:hypothetical protein